jgi:hypothetical protein
MDLNVPALAVLDLDALLVAAMGLGALGALELWPWNQFRHHHRQPLTLPALF